MLKTMNKKITLVLLLMLTVVSSLVLFVSPTYAAETSGLIFENPDGDEYYAKMDQWYSVAYYHDENVVKIKSGNETFSGTEDGLNFKLSYGILKFETPDGDEYYAKMDQWYTVSYFPDENVVKIMINGETFSGTEDGLNFKYSLHSDNVQPVISGETTFVSNVDEQRPLSYFTDWLRAYDETDGDITSKIKVDVDNYTANKSVLGTHTITVSVTDNSGNKATAVINIYVADVTKPVITGSTAVAQIGYKETYNIANFKASLTVTDNYDTLTHSSITVKADAYTANKAKLGTYDITFAVKDSSGNEGTFTKQVKVIDNVKPVFDGPLTIATSNTTIMTESDVRARLTASDEIDGNLTTKIKLVEDNYSGKGNRVGSYTIKYSVTDNAGNIAEHTVTINRTDTMPPKIYVENGKTIRIPQGTTITREQVLDILESTGVLKVNAMTTFSFPVDEYTGNEETPGAYLMSIKARSTNGNEDLFNVTLQVLSETETPNTDDDIVKGDDKTWFEKNYLYVGIGALALVGLAVLFLNRKRK